MLIAPKHSGVTCEPPIGDRCRWTPSLTAGGVGGDWDHNPGDLRDFLEHGSGLAVRVADTRAQISKNIATGKRLLLKIPARMYC